MPDETVSTEPGPRSRVEAAIGQTLATFDEAYAAVGSIESITQRSHVRDALVWANVWLIKALRHMAGEGHDEVADDLAGRVRRLEVEMSMHSEALAGLMRVVHIEGGR